MCNVISDLCSSSFPVPGSTWLVCSSPQHWNNISKSIDRSLQWPQTRRIHAASHLFGSLFVIVGGVDYSYHTLNDMWLCDTTTKLWKKVLFCLFLCALFYGLPQVTILYVGQMHLNWQISLEIWWFNQWQSVSPNSTSPFVINHRNQHPCTYLMSISTAVAF